MSIVYVHVLLKVNTNNDQLCVNRTMASLDGFPLLPRSDCCLDLTESLGLTSSTFQ